MQGVMTINILIFSDTHGNVEDPIEVIRQEKSVGAVIHAGDFERDARTIQDAYPNIPVYSVPGNCDILSDSPTELTTVIGGKKIFITHGHTYNVKFGLSRILNKASYEDYDLIVFGHTHKSIIEYAGSAIVVNPGSIKGYTKTYAKAVITNDTLRVSIEEF